MKRLIFLLLFMPALCVGQSYKPDYEDIRMVTSDSTSPYFFKTLMQRYLDHDTLFNLDEFRYLYYGYTYQPEYSPYASSDFEDSVNVILDKEELTEQDWDKLLQFNLKVLEKCPFHPRYLNLTRAVYKKLGDAEMAHLYNMKVWMVFETILSSGDGKTEKTAYHIIAVPHEYDLLNYLDLEFGGSQTLTGGMCDYLEVKRNKEKLKGVYFDVNRLFDVNMEQMKLGE